MKLSIVIIEYHCINQVIDCINSINHHLHDIEKECLVISNSEYSDNDISSYQEQLTGARLINTKGNLGYAGGVNTAIKHVNGEYLYIINPDCLLTDSNVCQIIEQMGKVPEWAITGPLVVDSDDKIQPSCRQFPKLWTFLLVRSALAKLTVATNESKRYLMHDFDHLTTMCVDWVSGGAVIIKTACIEKIGGMDERYFLYMEDVDWCRIAWNSGYKVVYCPDSKVIHAGQHQSIKLGLNMFTNVHIRWHLTSLFKYFIKFNFKFKPGSSFYKQCMNQPL